MPVVSLRIDEPIHGSAHVASGAIRLRGTLVSTGHPTLFFKWYSNLVPPPAPTSRDASIVVPGGGDPRNFIPAAGLPVGTHVLTFSAKDVAGDSREDLEAVAHAGIAGGPAAPGSPAPCVIHVFIATIVAPLPGATLSKAAATLIARAPFRWPDPPYQAINQLQFRWRFAPVGPPPGRASADLVPTFAQLAFDPNPPVVRYQGALPAALGVGNYQLILRVERTIDPAGTGHQVLQAVGLTA